MVIRRDIAIRKWARWLREDLGSRPYALLRPDFVPSSPFLVVKDPQIQSSRILVEPHLTDAEFRKAWMPFFVGLAILLSLLIISWNLSVISCLKNLSWIFLGFRVGICRRLRRQRSLLQAVWMGGRGMRLQRCLTLGRLCLPGWFRKAYFA